MHEEAIQEKVGLIRSRLHRAHVATGKSTGELAAEVGLPAAEVGEYLTGRRDLTVAALLRLTRALEKPLWWFLGERPEGISLEEAEASLKNLERMRMLVEAVSSQFLRVTGGPTSSHELPRQETGEPQADSQQRVADVVDLGFYRARARQILARENKVSNDLDEESVEMIAHGLYTAERRASQEER